MGDTANNNQDDFSNQNYELKFPYSIKPIDSDTNSELLKDFTGKFGDLFY